MRKRRLPFRKYSIRLWLGVLVTLCLLVNQWAVAAYVCPTNPVPVPCQQHADAKQPGLCHQHCNPVPLSSVDGKAPTVPPALVPPLPPSTLVVALADRSAVVSPAIEAAPGAPPPIIRFCRYLI